MKNRFKRNLFSIEISHFPGELRQQLENQQCQVCSQRSVGSHTCLEVRLPAAHTANDLLQLFMQHTDIHAFNEIMPTMSEIFIGQVERANQQPSHGE